MKLSLTILITLLSWVHSFTNTFSSSSQTQTKLSFWPFQRDLQQLTGKPVIDAVLEKNLPLLKELTGDNMKANVLNEKDESGSNAMHIIAKKGHYKYPPQEIPAYLIEKGININAVNNDGQTALEISLLSGWQKIAMLLLDNGADRSVVTSEVKSKITCPDCKRVVNKYKL